MLFPFNMGPSTFFPKSISDAWVLVWFTLPQGERHRSDDRVDGRETVGNSLGRAVGTGFTQRSFTQRSFTRQMFYTEKLVHREDFTHRIFYTENFYTQERFYTQKLLHREVFVQGSLDTEKLAHSQSFTQRSFYTERLLHE